MSDRFGDNVQALFGYYAGEQMRGMLNKPLAAVELSDDKQTITFRFKDGSSQEFGVEGDCCSSSWIEHLTLPDDYVGAAITNVTEASMDRTDDEAFNPKGEPRWEGDEGREHESLQVYETRFVTPRGEIVLEYRNSSNGYYGGYLVAK